MTIFRAADSIPTFISQVLFFQICQIEFKHGFQRRHFYLKEMYLKNVKIGKNQQISGLEIRELYKNRLRASLIPHKIKICEDGSANENCEEEKIIIDDPKTHNITEAIGNLSPCSAHTLQIFATTACIFFFIYFENFLLYG